MSSLLNEALHLNEHEAARWLNKDDIHSVNWLPADEILLPMIIKELDSSEDECLEECPDQTISTLIAEKGSEKQEIEPR